MIIHSGLIGIDVSKAHFDIFDAESGRTERHPNSGESARSLADRLQNRPQALAVFEATGRYDRHLRVVFDELGVAYARVNPSRARDFARAAGYLAKLVPAQAGNRCGRCKNAGRQGERLSLTLKVRERGAGPLALPCTAARS